MTKVSVDIKTILEGALMAAQEPLSLDRLKALFDQPGVPESSDVLAALEELRADYETRAIELMEVASGFRIQVRKELAPWVGRLWEEKPPRYSRALLETLALIAYRQPLTRGDIEEVRGVAVSTHIVRTLTERGWIRVVGHRDVPGRPALYATTKGFLDYFNLKSLADLPSLHDVEAMLQESRQSVPEEMATGASDGPPNTGALTELPIEISPSETQTQTEETEQSR